MVGGAPGRALRALLPIGFGHAAPIVLVAGAVVFGVPLDRTAMRALAARPLLVVAIRFRRRAAPRMRPPTGRIALALSSSIVSTAHGAGLMLLPALMPLRLANGSTPPLAGPARCCWR